MTTPFVPLTHPMSIVVFGATGDLFQRKLASALIDLYVGGFLSENVRIVGFARKQMTDEEFRAFVADALLRSERHHSKIELDQFLKQVFYVQGELTESSSYSALSKFLETHDATQGGCSHKLFYLAVPPTMYEPIFQNLSTSDMILPCRPGDEHSEQIWTRVLVEKPFGNDAEEAERLDLLLGKLYAEEQIFRIDHYLAKETLQNILTFRFSNALLEPLWNKDHIEKVELRLFEKVTAAGRGAFYDGVGALRDVGQNHLLQMLALIAMDDPGVLSAQTVHEKRAEIIDHVRPFTSNIAEYALRGQYEGFREEVGVHPDSDTETYFKVALGIDLPRWQGVPFILESGKAMSESRTEIVVTFRKASHCLCQEQHPDSAHQNVLTFVIQPNESIGITFYAKKPGFEFGLQPQVLEFRPTEDTSWNAIHDAYERVLFDCVRGDQTLFPSTKEVHGQWKVIAEIRDGWKDVPLVYYSVGQNPHWSFVADKHVL